MPKTLFDKIWDNHIVDSIKDGPDIIYIDTHYIHEVTSPQAFSGLNNRNIKVFRPEKTIATADHNVPTINQHLEIIDKQSREQINILEKNCKEHGIKLYGLGHEYNGIVHVIGPELGYTLPGKTIVCGDSHTATHGAFGSIAFGIGTSEVEMVFSSQCIIQNRPKKMRIRINGELAKGITSKDLILYIISQISSSGGTGYFVEFDGPVISRLSMEARMSLCNMSIEMGARGGLIAPDKITFDYIKGRKFAPEQNEYDKAVKEWNNLYSDRDAVFDKEITIDANNVEPMITFGTNPGMAISVISRVPDSEHNSIKNKNDFIKAIEYMGFNQGELLAGKKVNYVFVGSCTNGRIEDLRQFASIVKGKKKADNITALIVPGSKLVEIQAREEGITKIIEDSGFEMRQPGCSACLAMNDDKIPAGEYCIATSNRNFEGRQGPGARTILASPLTAAATAIAGKIADPREFLN
ncbi:3-isopropylmalate dehydratase large subunit [Bacteroidota bacterium]